LVVTQHRGLGPERGWGAAGLKKRGGAGVVVERMERESREEEGTGGKVMM
jgi:hypothetical protein